MVRDTKVAILVLESTIAVDEVVVVDGKGDITNQEIVERKKDLVMENRIKKLLRILIMSMFFSPKNF